MAEQGVLLENNKDKAQVILEPSFGAYGTDQRDTTPACRGSASMPSLTTGRPSPVRAVRLAELLADQPARRGRQGDRCIAYDVEERAPGLGIGRCSTRKGVRDHFFLGAGPYRMSSRGEVEQYPDESQAQTRKHFLQRLIGAFRGVG